MIFYISMIRIYLCDIFTYIVCLWSWEVDQSTMVKPRCFQITLRLVHTTMPHNSSLCSGNMVP